MVKLPSTTGTKLQVSIERHLDLLEQTVILIVTKVDPGLRNHLNVDILKNSVEVLRNGYGIITQDLDGRIDEIFKLSEKLEKISSQLIESEKKEATPD